MLAHSMSYKVPDKYHRFCLPPLVIKQCISEVLSYLVTYL